MSPQTQRIAITEECWKLNGCAHWVQTDYAYSAEAVDRMPDYLGSLDAMRAAEQAWFDQGWDHQVRYYNALCRIMGASNSGIHACSASAPERALAFLRVTGRLR